MMALTHQQKLAEKNRLTLQLATFTGRDAGEYYALVILRADRVREFERQARRKDFRLGQEGVVLFSGAGQPGEETLGEARQLFDRALKLLNSAAAAA